MLLYQLRKIWIKTSEENEIFKYPHYVCNICVIWDDTVSVQSDKAVQSLAIKVLN